MGPTRDIVGGGEVAGANGCKIYDEKNVILWKDFHKREKFPDRRRYWRPRQLPQRAGRRHPATTSNAPNAAVPHRNGRGRHGCWKPHSCGVCLFWTDRALAASFSRDVGQQLALVDGEWRRRGRLPDRCRRAGRREQQQREQPGRRHRAASRPCMPAAPAGEYSNLQI